MRPLTPKHFDLIYLGLGITFNSQNPLPQKKEMNCAGEFLRTHLFPFRQFFGLFLCGNRDGILKPVLGPSRQRIISSFPHPILKLVLDLKEHSNLADTLELARLWSAQNPTLYRNRYFAPLVDRCSDGGLYGRLYIDLVPTFFRFRRRPSWFLKNYAWSAMDFEDIKLPGPRPPRRSAIRKPVSAFR